MALWTYRPQAVLGQTQEALTALVPVTPLQDVAHAITNNMTARFDLQYTVVTSSDCAGMAAFYTARRGPYEAFTWINPNDGNTYTVRFDGALQVEHFTPGYFRTNPLTFHVV